MLANFQRNVSLPWRGSSSQVILRELLKIFYLSTNIEIFLRKIYSGAPKKGREFNIFHIYTLYSPTRLEIHDHKNRIWILQLAISHVLWGRLSKEGFQKQYIQYYFVVLILIRFMFLTLTVINCCLSAILFNSLTEVYLLFNYLKLII